MYLYSVSKMWGIHIWLSNENENVSLENMIQVLDI